MWVVLLVVCASVAPSAAFVVWSLLSDEPGLVAASVVVGALNGLAAAWLWGRIAIGYLSTRMADVFTRIRYGQVFREGRGDGVLEWIERTTLGGEQKMHARKRKERADRLAATRR